jgi:hypothetical protein
MKRLGIYARPNVASVSEPSFFNFNYRFNLNSATTTLVDNFGDKFTKCLRAKIQRMTLNFCAYHIEITWWTKIIRKDSEREGV